MKEGDLTHRLSNSIDNEDIVLKTTNGGVLTFLFALLIEFERISIIPVLDRVS